MTNNYRLETLSVSVLLSISLSLSLSLLPFSSQSNYFQLLSLSCLYPLNPLQLWINHQWPPLGAGQYCSILY